MRARRPRSAPVILEDLGAVSPQSPSGRWAPPSTQFIVVLIAVLLLIGVAAALITLSLHGM
jgi:hypothetical protein